jgi:hypothetical protein
LNHGAESEHVLSYLPSQKSALVGRAARFKDTPTNDFLARREADRVCAREHRGSRPESPARLFNSKSYRKHHIFIDKGSKQTHRPGLILPEMLQPGYAAGVATGSARSLMPISSP